MAPQTGYTYQPMGLYNKFGGNNSNWNQAQTSAFTNMYNKQNTTPSMQDVANNPEGYANYDFSGIKAGSLGTNSTGGLWDSMGGMKGLQGGVNLVGSLAGLYGMYQQDQRGNEAMRIANAGEARNQYAFDESMATKRANEATAARSAAKYSNLG